MIDFVIIELEDGLTVVELPTGQSPEDIALSQGGTLVDPGPYQSFEEASDALTDLQYADEEEQKQVPYNSQAYSGNLSSAPDRFFGEVTDSAATEDIVAQFPRMSF